MECDLSTDHARMQIEVIHAFLSTSYWSPGIRRDVVETAIRNSLVIGAFDSATGRQVGFARVITDSATFAHLCDVFVLESHRGRGISKRMVRALLADSRLQTLRRWCLATRDAHDVYRPFGFAPVTPDRWMEKRMPPEGWQETPQHR